MIHHAVVQGSKEWRKLRCGVPTASQFHKVITPKTRKRSTQIEGYAMHLCAERLLGMPLETITTKAMHNGTELEESAKAAYAFARRVEIEPVGFMTTDDRKVGASPDGMITGVKLLEAKCPSVETHIGYMVLGKSGVDEKYFCQLQGQIHVSEFDLTDIISFWPGLPDVVVTVPRDEPFIAALKPLIEELLGLVDEYMAVLKQQGYEPRVIDDEQAEDIGPFGISQADVEKFMNAKFPKGVSLQ